MTEFEAITTVHEQFSGENGVIAQLKRGEGLDNSGVELVRAALDALRAAWVNRSSVPKTAVLPMVDVYQAIVSSAELYPDIEDELRDLAIDLTERVERVFLTPPPSMTEYGAMAVVWSQFTQQTSFVLGLHRREDLDREAVGEVQVALDTLAAAWEQRSCVPKSIVGAMLSIHADIAGHAGQDLGSVREIQAVADDLSGRVRRCLS